MRFLKIVPEMVRTPRVSYFPLYVSLDPGGRLLTAVNPVGYRGLLIYCSGQPPRMRRRANGAVTYPYQYPKYRRLGLGPQRLYLKKNP